MSEPVSRPARSHPAETNHFGHADGVLAEAVAAVRQVTDFEPEVAIILGSGLGPLADEIDAVASFDYDALPGFSRSDAPGHPGRLVLGMLEGRKVVAMQGRFHYYEGVSAQQCGFPVRVMHTLGADSLVVSNACGGLDPNWQAGELMLQLDFINASGSSALRGANDARLGPRFPVLFDAYDPAYLVLARQAARALDLTLREGVYLAIAGPSYATRAELRAFRLLGADAIGMSTVHEVTVAQHQGVRVLGLSVITDMAIPDSHEHASGDEVVAMADRAGSAFRSLVRRVLPDL